MANHTFSMPLCEPLMLAVLVKSSVWRALPVPPSIMCLQMVFFHHPGTAGPKT